MDGDNSVSWILFSYFIEHAFHSSKQWGDSSNISMG